MRALLCHCRHHLEAEDDETLLASIRDHLIKKHPAIPPTGEQLREIVATRAYNLEYMEVYASPVDAREDLDFEPY